MQRIVIVALLLGLAGLVISCQQDPLERQQKEAEVLSLAHLVRDQAQLLSIEGVMLQKEVKLNQDTEQLSLQLDAAGWAKELSWVSDADIADPAKRALYAYTEKEQDGGFVLRQYTKKDSDAIGVQQINLLFEPVLNELKQVGIRIAEDNAMYQAARQIDLLFAHDDAGEIWLQQYKIAGSQQIIMQGSYDFSISAQVIYPEGIPFH